MNLVCVPPNMVGDAWPLAVKFIEKALAKNELTSAGEVLNDLLAGKALLWLAANENKEVVGAGVTQIVVMSAGKVCEIVAWSADHGQHRTESLEVIESYARAEGCVKTRLIGRKGWARTLPDYKIRALIMERTL
jgi:hypothetical protein